MLSFIRGQHGFSTKWRGHQTLNTRVLQLFSDTKCFWIFKMDQSSFRFASAVRFIRNLPQIYALAYEAME